MHQHPSAQSIPTDHEETSNSALDTNLQPYSPGDAPESNPTLSPSEADACPWECFLCCEIFDDHSAWHNHIVACTLANSKSVDEHSMVRSRTPAQELEDIVSDEEFPTDTEAIVTDNDNESSMTISDFSNEEDNCM